MVNLHCYGVGLTALAKMVYSMCKKAQVELVLYQDLRDYPKTMIPNLSLLNISDPHSSPVLKLISWRKDLNFVRAVPAAVVVLLSARHPYV